MKALEAGNVRYILLFIFDNKLIFKQFVIKKNIDNIVKIYDSCSTEHDKKKKIREKIDKDYNKIR